MKTLRILLAVCALIALSVSASMAQLHISIGHPMHHWHHHHWRHHHHMWHH